MSTYKSGICVGVPDKFDFKNYVPVIGRFSILRKYYFKKMNFLKEHYHIYLGDPDGRHWTRCTYCGILTAEKIEKYFALIEK